MGSTGGLGAVGPEVKVFSSPPVIPVVRQATRTRTQCNGTRTRTRLVREAMAEPVFDHERLDVYRLSIDYVAFSTASRRRLPALIDLRATNGFEQPNRFH